MLVYIHLIILPVSCSTIILYLVFLGNSLSFQTKIMIFIQFIFIPVSSFLVSLFFSRDFLLVFLDVFFVFIPFSLLSQSQDYICISILIQFHFFGDFSISSIQNIFLLSLYYGVFLHVFSIILIRGSLYNFRTNCFSRLLLGIIIYGRLIHNYNDFPFVRSRFRETRFLVQSVYASSLFDTFYIYYCFFCLFCFIRSVSIRFCLIVLNLVLPRFTYEQQFVFVFCSLFSILLYFNKQYIRQYVFSLLYVVAQIFVPKVTIIMNLIIGSEFVLIVFILQS